MLGHEVRAGERALEAGIGFGVADDEVRGPVREAIHRAAGRHPGGDGVRATEVLHGREESRLDDSQHGRPGSSRTHGFSLRVRGVLM